LTRPPFAGPTNPRGRAGLPDHDSFADKATRSRPSSWARAGRFRMSVEQISGEVYRQPCSTGALLRGYFIWRKHRVASLISVELPQLDKHLPGAQAAVTSNSHFDPYRTPTLISGSHNFRAVPGA